MMGIKSSISSLRTALILIACSLANAGFFTSCGPSVDHIRKLEQIEGYWELQNGNNKVVEYWKKVSNDGYSGGSFIINGDDTTVLELLKIIKEKDDIYYIPTVFGQNENKPVKFRLSSYTDTSYTFRNPAHDFPDTITYFLHEQDSLIAVISGKGKRSRFGYHKVK
jgi:hypothetical protein